MPPLRGSCRPAAAYRFDFDALAKSTAALSGFACILIALGRSTSRLADRATPCDVIAQQGRIYCIQKCKVMNVNGFTMMSIKPCRRSPSILHPNYPQKCLQSSAPAISMLHNSSSIKSNVHAVYGQLAYSTRKPWGQPARQKLKSSSQPLLPRELRCGRNSSSFALLAKAANRASCCCMLGCCAAAGTVNTAAAGRLGCATGSGRFGFATGPRSGEAGRAVPCGFDCLCVGRGDAAGLRRCCDNECLMSVLRAG